MSSQLPDGSVAVLIPAGGMGQRFGGDRNKVFENIVGKPVWLHAVERFACRPDVGRIVMAMSDADRVILREQMTGYPLRANLTITNGGAQRGDSVRNALDCLDESDAQLVAVHDAARPFVPHADLDAVFDTAMRDGAALLGTPLTGSLKRSRDGRATNVDRRDLFVALTPQVFKMDVIRNAYARHRGFPVTDDAQLVERSGTAVTLVPGSAANIKLTHPEDLPIAEAILKSHARQ